MRNKYLTRFYFVLLSMLLFSQGSFAQNTDDTAAKSPINSILIGVAIFLVILCFALAITTLQLTRLLREARIANPKSKKVSGLSKWWSNLDKKVFTKAAPLEKEADVLLDHNYDGIKELDNALPPWWKWGFYITIIVAVIYLFRFLVFKTGPSPEEEYAKEMQTAAIKLEKYRDANKSKEEINETNVTLADATGISEGKKIFTGTCFPCHGTNGEGGIGPNLTDNYWLHGGSIHDVFKTITYGVPDKGMQAWGNTFSPSEIRDLASYVLSLKGSNPPNAKAPQGDLYEPGKTADSTTVKKDTLTNKPG